MNSSCNLHGSTPPALFEVAFVNAVAWHQDPVDNGRSKGASDMTRSELIDLMASQQSQLTTKDVELAVKLMIDHMAQSLSSGGRIEIRGFGSFPSTTRTASGSKPQDRRYG